MTRRWPFVVSTTVVFLAFYAWSALVLLVYALGECGEDSDLEEDEYERVCGGTSGFDGELGRNFAIVVVVATVAGLVIGIAAIRRRSWRGVAVLAAVLFVGGVTAAQLA